MDELIKLEDVAVGVTDEQRNAPWSDGMGPFGDDDALSLQPGVQSSKVVNDERRMGDPR